MWLLLVRHFVSIRTNAKVDLIQTNQVKLGGILGIRALLCLANNLECDESRPYDGDSLLDIRAHKIWLIAN